jgi:hypothetical protein
VGSLLVLDVLEQAIYRYDEKKFDDIVYCFECEISPIMEIIGEYLEGTD